MHESLISQGLSLLIYGMGTVMAFLALLVLVTGLLSRLLARYFPEPVVAPAPKRAAPAPVGAAPSPQIAAVITQAIAQHRARRGRH